ncbi:MAG: polysaccharide deacetylase family protein [Burkholderiales bacterium]
MANPRIPYQFSTSRPRLTAPQGKPIIVHLVVNVEHWPFDAPMPRAIVSPPHGKETVPDVPNFSWVEYGMRCGMPRILELLCERSLPASTALNASVIDEYADAANGMLDAGWEFIGHGYHQKSINAEGSERDTLERALERVAAFTGKRPRGYLSPGLRETYDTPDHLKSLGLDYVCDWVLEDVPVWMNTKNGPLVAMPYNLEINDTIIYAIDKHAAPEMFDRVVATVKRFERETTRAANSQVRIMPMGLHPHLIGVPHRIAILEQILDFLCARNDVVFMNGGQIADWFVAQSPTPR